MAIELVIWNRQVGIPPGYAQVEPGDAFLTRYIKTHS